MLKKRLHISERVVRHTAKDKIKWNGGYDADNEHQTERCRQAVITGPETQILSVPP